MDKPKRQKFKRDPIGSFHIHCPAVHSHGECHERGYRRGQDRRGQASAMGLGPMAATWADLFVAIDRTSKFAVAQLVEKANRKTAWEFLEHLLESVPYRIHTILTELPGVAPLVRATTGDGIQFAEQPRNRDSITFRKMRFDLICEANDIEHRLTKPNHPWSCEGQKTVRGTVFPSGGQVERMNRTIKDGEGVKRLIQWINRSRNVKRYHYDSTISSAATSPIS